VPELPTREGSNAVRHPVGGRCTSHTETEAQPLGLNKTVVAVRLRSRSLFPETVTNRGRDAPSDPAPSGSPNPGFEELRPQQATSPLMQTMLASGGIRRARRVLRRRSKLEGAYVSQGRAVALPVLRPGVAEPVDGGGRPLAPPRPRWGLLRPLPRRHPTPFATRSGRAGTRDKSVRAGLTRCRQDKNQPRVRFRARAPIRFRACKTFAPLPAPDARRWPRRTSRIDEIVKEVRT
jgi:hypothetical protein